MAEKTLNARIYQELLQHPQIYLTDHSLKHCTVEQDTWGPRVRTGGFAATFKVTVKSEIFALRCFTKLSPKREKHYEHISNFLRVNKSSIFVSTHYDPKGILYEHKYYPITTMDWIEGDTLGTYIYNNIGKPGEIAILLERFQDLVNELNKLKISHGDLSHSNIIVRNKELVLIDYDGMFVPSLKGFKSNEVGNKAFQHPGRTEDNFDSTLDYFSEIVIFLALKALDLKPSIYDDFGKGKEGLLFERADFVDPDNSVLIKELSKIQDLSNLIRNFVSICKSDTSNVPTLQEFISNSKIQISLPQTQYSYYIDSTDYPLDAKLKDNLLQREGDNVVVVGRIDDFHRSTTIIGDYYVMLNVGFWPNNQFTIVMWSEVLNMFAKANIDPISFMDKWVSVSGTISQYKSKPQIILESPADIAIISFEEAKSRLELSYNKREGATSTMYSPPIVESPRLTSSNNSSKGAFENRDTNEVLRDYLSSINRQSDRSSETSSGTIISQPPKPSQTSNGKSTIPDSGGSIEQRFEKGSVKPTIKDIESTDVAPFSQIKKAIGNAFSQIPGLFQKTKSSNDKEVTNRDNRNITNKPPTPMPNSLSGKPNTTPPPVIPRTTIKPKSQAAKPIKLPTDIVSSKINHKIFGEGIIIGIRGDIIEVSFSCGNKLFEYPKAFLDGFLSLIDQD